MEKSLDVYLEPGTKGAFQARRHELSRLIGKADSIVSFLANPGGICLADEAVKAESLHSLSGRLDELYGNLFEQWEADENSCCDTTEIDRCQMELNVWGVRLTGIQRKLDAYAGYLEDKGDPEFLNSAELKRVRYSPSASKNYVIERDAESRKGSFLKRAFNALRS